MKIITIQSVALLLLVARTASFMLLPPAAIVRTLSSLSLQRSLQLYASSEPSVEEEPEVVIEIEDLSMSQIAELIEVTFIQACMQLAQGYVDVLKLFIVSVKSAYQRSSSMSTVVDQVNACPLQTAGRPLVAEEVQLRTTWIYAVALMLDQVEYDAKKGLQRRNGKDEDDPIGREVKSTFGPTISALLELQETGGTLKTSDFMEQNASLLPENINDDDVQFAIASQTIKVMWYTLVVLQEEQWASGGSDDDTSPLSARPPIPRGSGVN